MTQGFDDFPEVDSSSKKAHKPSEKRDETSAPAPASIDKQEPAESTPSSPDDTRDSGEDVGVADDAGEPVELAALDERTLEEAVARLPTLERSPPPPPETVSAALVRDDVLWADVTGSEILLPSGAKLAAVLPVPDGMSGWRPIRVVDPGKLLAEVLPIDSRALPRMDAPSPSDIWPDAPAVSEPDRPPPFPVAGGYGFVRRDHAARALAFVGGLAVIGWALFLLFLLI